MAGVTLLASISDWLRGGVQPRGAAGSGEIVVLLNNDVDCGPDFLERLIAPWRADPRGLGRVAAAAPGRADDRQRRAVADPHARRLPPPAGPAAARVARESPPLTGPAGRGGRLPAHRVGAGRRAGRGDLRLHGGPRPRAAAARRGLGTSRRPTRAASTSARLRTATARPRSAATAVSGAATCCAATGCCAGARAPRALATEAIVVLGDLRSRATWRRCADVRAGGRRGAAARARPPADSTRRSAFALARAAAGRLRPPRRLTQGPSSRSAGPDAAEPRGSLDLRRPGRRADGGARHPLLGARPARSARARR